ncbi:TetR/AcrR family transcriptional regulator [Streptomyces sp. NBC_00669]|uniref:TetR/AcrR family transcriptional regulator n=1 Tax=Streptomyces sp. NBC_00669 TaxID=2976011 RepID=UPI002E35880D|nr:helix-turn-helix domain-containing protein [Streptomyces sp. NBC_00669]
MSEIRRRRQRVEVGRNRAAVVSAAIRVLAERPDASMAEIASEAGVTRQTTYVHFGTREALLAAVRDELGRRAFAVLEAADLEEGTATAALGRFLGAVGTLLAEQTALGRPGGDPDADASRHLPVEQRLEALIRRGRESGEFTTGLETGWLVAATIALGHAADQQIRAGRLDAPAAAEQFRSSVMRLYEAGDPGLSP